MKNNRSKSGGCLKGILRWGTIGVVLIVVTVLACNWIVIGRHNGMDVVGYDAKDAIVRKAYFRNFIRELLARVKAVYDICVDKQPKYLGEPVVIP